MTGKTKEKAVTQEEATEIGKRLHDANTEAKSDKSKEQPVAEDIISKGPKSNEDIDKIVHRLYVTKTKSMTSQDESNKQPNQEQCQTKKVSESELSAIIERLHTTETKASVGCNPDIMLTEDLISSRAGSADLDAIVGRLNSTHTKASSGSQECKPYEENKPIGYGLKMLPAIEGLDERFRGQEVPPEKVEEVIGKLHTTQTACSKARKDPPRILLYPERTTLMNNVERIVSYQSNGSVARQKELQRREKWFN